ncbi:biotin--protein ligase [Adelges cooleyi]|uniref:biotin--protein ligase n=1 Tax=Adelges cooleyi TaxID=133065 RepID=UPI0021807F3B|nr:biotin--protein ligase [Adelges cooleyi]
MLLTLFYMATTWFQSYRLARVKTNLKKYLSNHRTLVFYKEKDFAKIDSESICSSSVAAVPLLLRPHGLTSDSCKYAKSAQLDQIISLVGHKRSCSVFPEQILNLDTWILIPNYRVTFPALLNTQTPLKLNKESKINVLVEANYRMINQQKTVQTCSIESFGIPKAWNAGEYFGLLLETDLDHFAMLSMDFMASTSSIYLGNNMELFRIQAVRVEGRPCMIDNPESIASTIDFVYNLDDTSDNTVLTATQWKNYCDTLRAVTLAAYNVAVSGKSINFCSAVLSKNIDTIINIDDKIINKNVPDEVDGEINRSIRPTNFNSLVNSPKENSIQYVRFSNSFEMETYQNGSSNYNDTSSIYSSDSSSSDSINMRKSILSPLSEVEMKLSNGMKPIKSSPDVFGIFKGGSKSSPTMRNNRSFSDFTNSPDSKTRCHTPVQHRGESKTGKPPNIIIFSESASSAQEIENSLQSILHRYRYTIYTLSLERMLRSPWTSQATMVVIYGSVPKGLYPLLEYYLLVEGGRVLSLCSDLLGTFLPSAYSMAEVRHDEIVNFTYYPLSMQASLMHHILCYQPSASHDGRFQADSRNNKPAINLEIVDIFDSGNKHHAITVQVLAAENTWETPSLILATTPSGGRVVFSQVHLEIDPHQNGETLSNNNDRHILLKDLLSVHLGLDCVPPSDQEPSHTPAYLIGNEKDKAEFLSFLKGKGNEKNVLLIKDLYVQFCGNDEMCINVSENSLPIIYNDVPENFNEEEYFRNLHTKYLGQMVIYGDVMSTSMRILNDPILKHGIVVIPKLQVTGIGRGGNKWLSPKGCAMFSIQLHIPFDSKLGQRLALLQHVVALSVVSAVCSLPGGYDKLDLGLKWPNDIYAGGNAKIGGLVISSSAMGNMAICTIGCGVNLNNSLPTTCINDVIEEHNANTQNNLSTLSPEQYFGAVFTELERLLNQVEQGNVDIIFDLYYKYWLHSNTEVTVLRTDQTSFKALVIGLDDHGFLRVRSESGEIVDVRPDGNSFDMLAGLIAPK